MKLHDNLLFPHPILREDISSLVANDYAKSSEFRISFEGTVTSADEYKIESFAIIKNAEISGLINDGKAKVGYYVTCLDTYYSRLITVPLGKKDTLLDLNNLHGVVSLQPLIWATIDISSFCNTELDPDFGGSATFEKGNVIALGSEAQFSVDELKFEPIGTIFSLEISPDTEEGIFEVDSQDDTIKIYAAQTTCDNISAARAAPNGPALLLNCVYFPVLVQVLANLKEQPDAFYSFTWFKTIKAKCDELGFDLQDEKYSSLFIAQKLLKHPMKAAIATLGSGGEQ
jgi:hypothetical protein